MAAEKVLLFYLALVVASTLSAPTPEESKDLATPDKEDLQTAASHWGGPYGGYGYGLGGYGYGGYPYYGYGWGYPGYGWYGGGWPYGYGGYGGYWW